jgi:hypothetical protein
MILETRRRLALLSVSIEAFGDASRTYIIATNRAEGSAFG